ncbi:MAG: Uncharacterised protein [Opitutia bacterium UBA7350]|nr:MAG: Uncharacterised protein [Opitutae bacterium UBA7350]
MPTKKKTTQKVVIKKTPAKNVAKKAALEKAAKNIVIKKAPAKKTPKKAPAKKLKLTRIIARVDAGFGNQLYIRGENGGLNWESGILMENISPYEWQFTTHHSTKKIEYKFLINDELWSEGSNLVAQTGKESISSPTFAW